MLRGNGYPIFFFVFLEEQYYNLEIENIPVLTYILTHFMLARQTTLGLQNEESHDPFMNHK
jgi:hypothetical protein